jgi:beta-glucosidase
VSVGPSSRDLPLQTTVEVPGRPYESPLTIWSSFRDWLAHPIAGPAVQSLLDARGGVRGRKADLLNDPVGRESVLGQPMASLTQFPGFPLADAEAEAVLASLPGDAVSAA